MHLNDETLVAYRDTELSERERMQVVDHLAACPDCAVRLKVLHARSSAISSHLNILTPPVSFRASAHPALEKFTARQKEPSMKSFFRRPLALIAGLVLVLVVALSFPNVQALAGSFLGLFRVQQVKIIQVDANSLNRVNGVMQDNSDRLQVFFKQNMTISHNGEFQKVNTPDAAAKIAGFTPRLPAGVQVSTLNVNPSETADLVIDSGLMNSMLEALGRTDVKIPSNLDGQKIHAEIPSIVNIQMGTCPEIASELKRIPGKTEPNLTACKNLMEFNSPTVQAPDSFPIVQLGESMLQFLGMTPEQAKQYSQNIDWASTLVIPFPTTPDTTIQNLTVDSVSATLVHSGNQGQYTLIWVKNGVIYALAGWGDSSEAVALANTLQ